MKYVLTFPRLCYLYESAWAIHIRALLINDISLALYYRCVGWKASGISLYQVYWYDSSHFNLDLLSHALSISEKAANTAFLNNVFVSTWNSPDQRVRHCPMCIKQLYHSTWFFFSWLEKCPVHELTLEPCKKCSSVLTPVGIAKLQSADYVCEHLRPYRGQKFPQPRLDQESALKWDRWSRRMSAWIGRASKVSQLELLDIARAPLTHWSSKSRFLYWRYLETCAGKSPIQLNFPKVMVTRVKFPAPSRDSADGCSNLVACAKALRRYFFRRYVKKHRKCFNEIKRFGVNSCTALLGNRRCSCVLSYYAWMVSFLNVYTMIDLNSAKVNPYAPGSHLYRNVRGLDLRSFLLRGWISFYGAWAGIELCPVVSSKIDYLQVNIRLERGAEYFRPSFSFLLNISETGVSEAYHISEASLKLPSERRCRLRGSKKMISDGAPDDSGIQNVRREEFLIMSFPTDSRRARSLTTYI
jgi:hypothetical protein